MGIVMVLSSSDQNSIKRFSDNVNLYQRLIMAGEQEVFFQCLFDAHEQIVACPLIHYVYSYWQSEFGIRGKSSSRRMSFLRTAHIHVFYIMSRKMSIKSSFAKLEEMKTAPLIGRVFVLL